MPRYFFDIYANGKRTQDDEGLVFPSEEAVRREALKVLPSIAREEAAKDGDRQAYTVMVTDKEGRPVYSATMTYAGLWLRRETGTEAA